MYTFLEVAIGAVVSLSKVNTACLSYLSLPASHSCSFSFRPPLLQLYP